jgi:hypothetical protein
MKLHSPRFERGLKRMVKETIRQSPELKREYRKTRRYSRDLNLGWIWRLVLTFILGGIAWHIQEQTGHINAVLAFAGIYLLAALCLRSLSLLKCLNFSVDQPALTNLPVSMNAIFRWQIQKLFLGSLFLLIDLLVILGVLACMNDFSSWKWAITLIYAVVAWSYMLSLALFCALRFPHWPYQLVSSGLFLLGFVLFIGRSVLEPWTLRLLDGAAPALNIFLPTAWPVASFELLRQPDHWWLLVLWLPVVVIIGSFKNSLTGLRDGLSYREIIDEPASDLLPGEDPQLQTQLETSRHLGITEIEGVVASGTFMEQPGIVLQQFPERKLWAWLNVRERVLAEFTHPTGMAIGSAWRKIYTILLGTTFLVILAGWINPVFQLSTLGLGVFVVFCMSLANLANHGRAFAQMCSNGVNIPMYANFGIGFKELTRFFLKYSIIQLPFLLGICLVLAGLSAWCLKFPITVGLIFGLKLAGLIYAGNIILIVFAFSSGTNDTSRFRLSSILMVIGVVMFGFAFLGLGAASLFIPFPLPAFLLWVGALFDAWLFYWSYGCFFRFCRFDLISQQR